jgi:putative ABC transport system permease protein
VTRLSDSSFADRSSDAAIAALRADPHGVLVDAATADDLSVETGDRVRIVLALGTSRETAGSFRVVGLLTRLAGFPQPPNLVVGLDAYAAATTVSRVDFFLARTPEHGHAGLARAVSALRSGPGRRGSMAIETTETALDKDQSSLTALDVRSLVDLGSLFTLLMSAAVLAIFLFGLILQRRREYVVLRAQGMHEGEIRSLVLGEAALVAAGGLASGLLVGVGSAFLLVQVLRPLFILPPGLALPASTLAVLALVTVAAALACGVAALMALRRVRPTEILREA